VSQERRLEQTEIEATSPPGK